MTQGFQILERMEPALLKKKVYIVASRGRDPQKPSSRIVGGVTEQRLEINKRGITNTITSVQKDNYVLEIRSETTRKLHGIGEARESQPGQGL